jgi:hypothetical protein
MAENPQADYWRHTWKRARGNMPWKLTKTGCRSQTSGQVATLMRVLGLRVTKSNPRSMNFLDYKVVYFGQAHGVPPSDPEVRRKLEICAGPYGKLMAWTKLKELGIAGKYEKPGG